METLDKKEFIAYVVEAMVEGELTVKEAEAHTRKFIEVMGNFTTNHIELKAGDVRFIQNKVAAFEERSKRA